MLWEAMTRDRRFAGLGFKRQTPIGPHIVDLVSFPLRTVIDIAPAEESETAAKASADRRAWLAARGYHIVEVHDTAIAVDVASVVADVLARLAPRLPPQAPPI
jgi:tRNA/rRNA methyltransferase